MAARQYCAICGFGGAGALTRVVVEGRELWFCPGHASELPQPLPSTLDEVRRCFGFVAIEQRSGRERRAPKPVPGKGPVRERRKSKGRRSTDRG
jgi:ribosome-binding protein aMBF1 (putative translation factor)